MTKAKTQIVKAELKDLIHADWNYKTDGTDEQISVLANAISNAGSAGVLAVREIKKNGKDVLEVMDGNHRLTALRLLQWQEIAVENFGPISQAKAIVLTRQRNEQWFDDDKLKLSNLFVDYVFPEISKEELAEILPETLEQLNVYEEMTSMDWSEPEKDQSKLSGEADGMKTIKVVVEEEVFNLWKKWLERAQEVTGIDSPSRAIEFAIIEALNVPEEMLVGEMKKE